MPADRVGQDKDATLRLDPVDVPALLELGQRHDGASVDGDARALP